jgi:hypothetical protein
VDYGVRRGRDDAVSVRLRAAADTYAYLVAVSVSDGGARFSDNYLELEPGEERTVRVTAPDGSFRAEDVTVRFR